MENTQGFRAGDGSDEASQPLWFVVIGEKWLGPMSAVEILQKIETRDLTPAHFVWRKGMSRWKRISELEAFQVLFPAEPSSEILAQVVKAEEITRGVSLGGGSTSKKKTPPPPPSQKPVYEVAEWYIFYQDTQFGPFTASEVERLLTVGKIHGGVHAWSESLADWKRLDEIERFSDSTGKTKAAKESKKKKSEQRGTPRKPLVARVLLADREKVSAAICRDVSVGGMQVLTDQIPGPPGTKLKLNISPSGLKPFTAEGIVVRILEDGRGFSFRFEKLQESARRAIEDYVKQG